MSDKKPRSSKINNINLVENPSKEKKVQNSLGGFTAFKPSSPKSSTEVKQTKDGTSNIKNNISKKK